MQMTRLKRFCRDLNALLGARISRILHIFDPGLHEISENRQTSVFLSNSVAFCEILEKSVEFPPKKVGLNENCKILQSTGTF